MIKLFVVCSGLGRVNRGYESFARECFDALVDNPNLKVSLWKGGDVSKPKETVLWNLPRDSQTAKLLGKLTRRGSYFIEQLTFTLSLLPRVSRLKPDIIYFSDGNLGNFLWHWRRLTGSKYKLLFSNGAPFLPPFDRWDYVQQVAPTHFQDALAQGENAQKQEVVPYGIRMQSELCPLSFEEKQKIRKSLNLPLDRPIVISVAAVNKSHKRMDYLIREVAALPSPRPFLLMLGQQDEETPAVLALAQKLLGEANFAVRTVPWREVHSYYSVSDIFVLASLSEGFGRVFLEAASYGLVCFAHDYDLTRYVLGEYGEFGNFERPSELAALLQNRIDNPEDESKCQARHLDIYKRFSWDVLTSPYVKMIQNCHSMR